MSPTTHTLVIILTGVGTVVGGILVLRMHAFVALISGAIVVALITPTSFVEQAHINRVIKPVQSVTPAGLVLKPDDVKSIARGAYLQILYYPDPSADPQVMGEARLRKPEEGSALAVPLEAIPRGGFVKDGKPITELWVAEPTALKTALSNAGKTIGERLAAGFGSTAASIGILIAMAAIVAKCLVESGSADKIVRAGIRSFGVSFAPLAFLLAGFLLGIPVFFNNVFLLMAPLAKATHLRTKRDYLLYVMAIICGGTMTHSLVPPTPGPLIVTHAFDINMGTMMITGSIFSLLTALVGYVFAMIMNRFRPLPLRDSPDCPLADLERQFKIDESQLPPLWLALAPILLPVIMISSWSTIEEAGWLSGTPARIAETLGESNIAMTLAAVVAMATVIWKKKPTLQKLGESLEAPLSAAGMIIVIVSAGGAFGGVLADTGVANLARNLPQSSALMIILVAWTVSAALRAAQGSATVSMTTCSAIFLGLAFEPSLPFHKVYLAMAIATGSKPLSWMNDSGFWVMTKMSGMTEKEGLMYVTTLTTVLGIAGLGWVLLAVALFPMAGGG